MCGRFSLYEDKSFYPRFKIKGSEYFNFDNVIRPSEIVPVIKKENRENVLSLMSWGFVPDWAKDEIKYKAVINARAETLVESPYFRESIKNNRCVIPASSFYEWKENTLGKKVMYSFVVSDSKYMGLGGVFTTVKQNFAIITQNALSTVTPYHDRQPLIIPPEFEDDWFNIKVNQIKDFIREISYYSEKFLKVQ